MRSSISTVNALAGSLLAAALAITAPALAQTVSDAGVERICGGPIIAPDLDPSIGENIQGPSLIRVPDWVPGRLGRYYLYFADHKGRHIRLAYADDLCGPWRIHEPGTLRIEQSHFLSEPPSLTPDEEREIRERSDPSRLSHDPVLEATTPHIASPDVHVDDRGRRIVMYYHGLAGVSSQTTRVATSANGIDFEALPETLGRTYWRAFDQADYRYALAMPGQLYRSRDPLGPFAEGPRLFNPNMRHSAVLIRGETMYVFWSRVGDAPEVIYLSTVDLSSDWMEWRATPGVEILRPEHDWEGADAPVLPSVRSTAYGHVNQLRDPAIFEENGRVYLLYAVAGESGIAIAEVRLTP